MRVSILLPFYNAVSTLAGAVESMLAQSFEDWELLLMDDGSTDGGTALAKCFAQVDARIQLHVLSHGGIVSALNSGLSHAKGELIARMDADDVSLSERLKKQHDYMVAHSEVDVLACQVSYGGDREQQAGYAAYVDWQNSLISHADHYENRFVDAPLAHPSVMFRRGVVERHGAYREGAFPEDFELWLRWMQSGVCFAKLPEPLLQWNDLPSRLSRCDTRYDATAFYNVKCRYLEQSLPKDRPVWLWGAGRATRQRFASLEPFAGYIDVDKNKIGQRVNGKAVVSPEDIPKDAYVISGVANRGIREQIKSFLDETGRKAVQDYTLCA